MASDSRRIDPRDLHPADRRRQCRRRDAAFGGFLYFGCMLALAFVLNWIPPTTPGYWQVGAFLAFPALVLAVPAGLLALTYTIVVRREPRLWLLLATLAAVGPVLWLAPLLPQAWDAVVGAFFVVWTAVSLVSPLAWFFGGRGNWRRSLPGELPNESDRPW